MTWIYLVSAGILAALSNISLKHGLTQVSALVPEVYSVWQRVPYWAGSFFIWLGLLGLGTAFFCYLAGLSHVKLNTAYPIPRKLVEGVCISICLVSNKGTECLDS